MSEEPGARKLAAILAIDLVGYSALSEEDEAQAVTAVSRLRDALEGAALVHGGRIFNTAGDGFMLEFCSAAGALGAIDELWNAFERSSVRIGVHMGDVLATPSGDLLGHSVNVAARLQQIAQPGAVMVSMDVRRAVRGKLQQRLHAAGAIQKFMPSSTTSRARVSPSPCWLSCRTTMIVTSRRWNSSPMASPMKSFRCC